MDFENRLKRELSQGAFKCLLEDCGYRVVPLGIEAVIREVACLDKEAYKNLDFSDAVRFLPDFCILDQNQKHKFIVEVKYRWDWDGNILKEVSNQVRMFKDIILVVFIGDPPDSKYTPRPSTYVRCCKMYMNEQNQVCAEVKESKGGAATKTIFVEEEDLSELRWWDLKTLQDYFPDLNNTKEEGSLVKAIKSINGILKDNL
ncbi:MAG: hypothetical protein WA240_15460 [Nitrospirota bacterium]